jgi:hypothetical protein
VISIPVWLFWALAISAVICGNILLKRLAEWAEWKEYDNFIKDSGETLTFEEFKSEKVKEEAWKNEKGISHDEWMRRVCEVNRHRNCRRGMFY